MDFKELEYILVIAREKNISRAAEHLFMSQPALSRFLLKVEERLGTGLFVRKNRQYLPTQAGELYLDMARKIMSTKQDFDVKLRECLKEDEGSLSFGITPGRARTILPKVIPAFHEAYPNFELNVFEEDVKTLERYVQEGKVEAAFYTMADDPGSQREGSAGGSQSRMDKGMIRYELISREEVIFCAAKGSGYSMLAENRRDRKYPWLDMKLAEHDCFLLLKNDMRLGQFAEKILAGQGISPKIMRLSSIDTVLALVAQKYGVAFASSFRLEEHQQAGNLDIFSIGDTMMEWDFVAAYRNDYQVKRPMRYLMRLMGELGQR